MTAGPDLSLPLDHYQLLCLQPFRAATPEAVRRAYDSVLSSVPTDTYSADTLFSRAVLLRAAAECLADPEQRRSYDAKLQTLGRADLRVSQHDLPGALVLLQERGEYHNVIEHGTRWLDRNTTGSLEEAADIAACLALAYCDRARVCLETEGTVLRACADLEAALGLLRRHHKSERLQDKIGEALQELAPDYSLELLALPLTPQYAVQRTKGVALLRVVVSQRAEEQHGDRSLATHTLTVLSKAKELLTAAEQTVVLPGTQACGMHPASVAYDLALAFIVEGYKTQQPHHILRARRLLVQASEHEAMAAALSSSAATSTPQGGSSGGTGSMDQQQQQKRQQAASTGDAASCGSSSNSGVPVERAVCAVLLDDMPGALELLNLVPSSRQRLQAPDPHVEDFVRAHSPSPHLDLSPGVMTLAERWLQGVALQSFRDMRDDAQQQQALSLEHSWFRQPKVALCLQAWRLTHSEQVVRAIHAIMTFFMAITQRAAALAAAVLALTVSKRAAAAPASGPASTAPPSHTSIPAGSMHTPHNAQASHWGGGESLAGDVQGHSMGHVREGYGDHSDEEEASTGSHGPSLPGPRSPLGSATPLSSRSPSPGSSSSSSSSAAGAAQPSSALLIAHQQPSPRSPAIAQPASLRAKSAIQLDHLSHDDHQMALQQYTEGFADVSGSRGSGTGRQATSTGSGRSHGLEWDEQQLGHDAAYHGGGDRAVLHGSDHHHHEAYDQLGDEGEHEATEQDMLAAGLSPLPVRSEEELRRQLRSLEAAMWDSVDPSRTSQAAQRKQLLYKLGAAAAVVVAVAAMAMLVMRPAGQAAHRAGPAALYGAPMAVATTATAAPTSAHGASPAMAAAASVSASVSVALGKRDAEALLKAWFAAKALALGPAYQVSVLPSVLGGSHLDKWTDVVKQLRTESLHWRLDLLGAKVNSVRQQAPGEWEVSATVQEEGTLLDENGSVQDTYRTKYNVKYTAAVGGAGNAWVIVAGEDL